MKLLVINNLASGFGEGSVYDFIRSFARDGDEVCVRSTDGTTDVRDLLGDAEAFDAVVASGGDFPDRTGSLEIHRAREVRVEADPPMEAQYDGEATNLTTPFTAHIMRRAARFFVSEEGWDLFAEK